LTSSMRSLKRSWTGSSVSTRTQKRTCSNPSYESSAILTRNGTHTAAFDISSKILHSNIPVLCIHKHRSGCGLSLPMCCACADRRPTSQTYLAYADAFGDTVTSSRSIHYCTGCRGMLQRSAPWLPSPDRQRFSIWAGSKQNTNSAKKSVQQITRGAGYFRHDQSHLR
jgi:predicted Fe-S protein YdhL (DUF1289 family)